MKRRAFYLILITTVTTVVMYTPYIIAWILNGFFTQNIGITFLDASKCIWYGVAFSLSPPGGETTFHQV